MKTLIALLLLAITTGVAGANNAGMIADFQMSDVRWLTIENWTWPGHPQSDFARQADGNWYAVNDGVEIDYQIHPSQAAAIDTLITDIIAIPVIDGPLAYNPPQVETWSVSPNWTPPDFCAGMITDGHEYRNLCVFRAKDGTLWAMVYDSGFHMNWYQVASDDVVMSDLNALPGA
jgi:hypothetical protein